MTFPKNNLCNHPEIIFSDLHRYSDKKHVCPPFKPENSKHFWPAPYFQAHPKGFHRAIVALELPLGWISSETQVFFKLKIYLIATATSCHVSFCEI